MNKHVKIYMVIAFFALVFGCRFFTTPIGHILRDPRQYNGKIVHIYGTVQKSVNVIGIRYYIVRDHTGEIPVITDGAVPPVGVEVRVKGIVHQAYSLFGKQLVVIFEENE